MEEAALIPVNVSVLQAGVDCSAKKVPAAYMILLWLLICKCHSYSLLAVCDPPCLNGGECNSDGSCTCAGGWTGAQCEQGN